MRTRSFIFVLLLLALCVAAGVALIQRSRLSPTGAAALGQNQPAETPVPVPEEQERSEQTVQSENPVTSQVEAQAQAPIVEERAARVQGIEGLELQMSRPLMFDIGQVYGFGADEEYLYVGSSGASTHSIAIYQARRSDLTFAQMRVLPQDVNCHLGGLDVGNEHLVATLLREGESGTALLFVDRKLLDVARMVDVPVRLGPVAQGQDGLIYAYGLDDNVGYALDAEGSIVQQSARGSEISYHGLDTVNGRLLCAGWDAAESVGVIDIVEPSDFSIVMRHRVYLKPSGSESLSSNGLAVHQDTFFFMAGASPRPMVMSFGLDEVTITQFAP